MKRVLLRPRLSFAFLKNVDVWGQNELQMETGHTHTQTLSNKIV